MGIRQFVFGICQVVAFGLIMVLMNSTEKSFCEVAGFGITDL